MLLAFAPDRPDADGMETIRENCFAISLGERDKFCAGIAAPVFSYGASLLGALSLSGPKERFSDEDVIRMRRLLLHAAKELTASFGASYPIDT